MRFKCLYFMYKKTLIWRTIEEDLFMEESFHKILDSLIKEYSNTYYNIPEIQEYKMIDDDKKSFIWLLVARKVSYCRLLIIDKF